MEVSEEYGGIMTTGNQESPLKAKSRAQNQSKRVEVFPECGGIISTSTKYLHHETAISCSNLQ